MAPAPGPDSVRHPAVVAAPGEATVRPVPRPIGPFHTGMPALPD